MAVAKIVLNENVRTQKKILVAVSGQGLQKCLYTLLQDQGYAVTTADSGEAALAALRPKATDADQFAAMVLSDDLPGTGDRGAMTMLSQYRWQVPTVLLHNAQSVPCIDDRRVWALLLAPFDPSGIMAAVNGLAPQQESTIPNPTKKILIVEDERDVSLTVSFALGLEGFFCQTAASGPEALNKASWLNPDLVLLDLNLPGLDGTDVCLQLRSTEALADVPIIIVSARGSRQDISLGKQIGATNYITKPFALDDLIAQVRRALNDSAAAKASADKH